MHCTIIGNGSSRKNYILKNIEGITFGSNTVYLEHLPSFLIAQDVKILEQMSRDRVQTVFVPRDRRRIQRDPIGIPNMQLMESLPNQHFRLLLSGEWCMVLAARLGFTRLHLIAFDGGPGHADRGRTASNQTLEWCESTLTRYQTFERDLLGHFPGLIITQDEYFMRDYK